MISPTLTITIDWLCLLVTYLMCGMRMVIRCSHKRKRKLAKYDTEVILCLALAVATGSVSVNTWKNVQLMRAGRLSETVTLRLPEVPPEETILSLKLLYAQSFIYFIIMWLIKAAFLSTYFHFRQKMTRPCKIALYILTALVIISFVVITLMMFLTCLPIERAWSLGSDFCSPQQKAWSHFKTAAANIATDLFLIILFLVILRNLHLGSRERWGIFFFLCISVIPILAAILRLVIIILVLHPTLMQRKPSDVQRFNDVLYLASEIEVTTAFIAACLPAMRVFFRERQERKEYWKKGRMVSQARFGEVTRDDEDELWDEIEMEGSSLTELRRAERGV